ncbi:MAG: hypothetical protein J0H82_18480 [Alphaproteobacteria bacterium]|jgi:hypothetical protein|nr:hypothetical protein [Alphaproteobacteria bacterium]
MPNLAFPSVSASGAPIAIGTAATTLHTARASVKTELSIVVMNSDAANDYNLSLIEGGVTIGVIKVEKLAGPYQVLPPVILGAGVTISGSCPTANKLYAWVSVTEF